MVHDMVGGCVENPSERAFDEPVGINFKAGMPQDVVEQLPAHEGTKGKWVDWHQRSGEWKNPCLNQSLPWTEGKGSPWTGIVGLVMNTMHPFENARSVHPAVRPIKVGIVQQDREQNTGDEPAPAVLGEVKIHPHPSLARGLQGQGSNEPKDACAGQAVTDFPEHVPTIGPALNDFPVKPSGGKQAISQRPGDQGHDSVACDLQRRNAHPQVDRIPMGDHAYFNTNQP